MRFLKKKRPEHTDAPIDPMQRLMLESGVSPEFFNRAILGTLNTFGKRLNWDSHMLDTITKEGRYVLSKRRNYLLPVGCEPEDLHSAKDLWTFTVWLAFLIHKLDNTILIDQKPYHSYVILPLLESFLDSTAWMWLVSNKLALEAISGFIVRDQMNNNAKVIQEILGLSSLEKTDKSNVRESPPSPQYNDTQNQLNVTVATNAGPSKLELGSGFIQHLQDSMEDLPAWARIVEDGIIDVESPKAFIEYSEMTGLNWKHVQKGVQRLGYHMPDTTTGNVFRKIAGKSVMRLNLHGGKNV